MVICLCHGFFNDLIIPCEEKSDMKIVLIARITSFCLVNTNLNMPTNPNRANPTVLIKRPLGQCWILNNAPMMMIATLIPKPYEYMFRVSMLFGLQWLLTYNADTKIRKNGKVGWFIFDASFAGVIFS